ncbi:MAG TPA: hypothetical protein VFJ14_01745 [Nocardioidaceae bacterium]|nr:hypothetical protein [Nocardioidaceae bacterium]
MTFYDEMDPGACCTWCGGEGITECDQPVECDDAAHHDGLCTCRACGGTGLAKDQVIW